MEINRMNNEDYIYCNDCNTYVDFFQYDHNIKDAGHDRCNWRFVTDEELKQCVKECIKDGCLEPSVIQTELR